PSAPKASTAAATPKAEPKLSLSKKSLKESAVFEKKVEPKKGEVKKKEPKAPEKKAVTKKTKKNYVPLRYFQSKPLEISKEQADANAFIMIQNIATGKLRVYQTAKVAGEPNLLILETDMFNGEVEPQKTRRTALGSYKIEKWIKFYQDNQGVSPSWYD